MLRGSLEEVTWKETTIAFEQENDMTVRAGSRM